MIEKIFIAILLFSNAAYAVDMDLFDLAEKQHKLSDFKGNWVVVNYWASWCAPCLQEMPELQDFHDRNMGKGAMVIGINIEGSPRKALLRFLDDYFISYPIYISTSGTQTALGLIPGLPTSFLVSPEGDVVETHVGPVTTEMIEIWIQKWEGKPYLHQGH